MRKPSVDSVSVLQRFRDHREWIEWVVAHFEVIWKKI
jgi:hypothetical protein